MNAGRFNKNFFNQENLKKNMVLALLGFLGLIIAIVFSFICDSDLGKIIIWFSNIIIMLILFVPLFIFSIMAIIFVMY